jgi:regulator of protease activity HflC (stomatin/prohibitin superfamily)
MAHEIEQIINGPASSWGVYVEGILIKDMQMSPELVESLSSGAKQKRISESKIIAAEAEVQAAQLMRKASDILSSHTAMQMRYLDVCIQFVLSTTLR